MIGVEGRGGVRSFHFLGTVIGVEGRGGGRSFHFLGTVVGVEGRGGLGHSIFWVL